MIIQIHLIIIPEQHILSFHRAHLESNNLRFHRAHLESRKHIFLVSKENIKSQGKNCLFFPLGTFRVKNKYVLSYHKPRRKRKKIRKKIRAHLESRNLSIHRAYLESRNLSFHRAHLKTRNLILRRAYLESRILCFHRAYLELGNISF